MCKSILKIAQSQKSPVQYSVRWSHKIAVSDDLRNFESIRIEPKYVEYLERASQELALASPKLATVEGVIIELNSKVNPHSDAIEGRSVTIRGHPKGERERKIFIPLTKENYLMAISAHRKWRTISVKGELGKVSGKWQLNKASEFKIIS